MEQQHPRQHVEKPRLEIPDPKLLPGNLASSSPRSMHGFPTSPEYTPSSSREAKSFDDWSSQSPSSLAPVINCEEDGVEVEKKKRPHFYVGEFVLVRCNHSKWLLGQVRRSSKNGVIVWVAAAQTLVNVPYDLLVSHLVKPDSPSLPPSPDSSFPPETVVEVGRDGQLLAPFQCVRPAHLSHRKLYRPLKHFLAEGNKAPDAGVTHTGMSLEDIRKKLLVDRGSTSLPTYTPGNLETLQALAGVQGKAAPEIVGDRTLEDLPHFTSSICRFKFSDGDAKFGLAVETENESKFDWITVIENGLDIRKKQLN